MNQVNLADIHQAIRWNNQVKALKLLPRCKDGLNQIVGGETLLHAATKVGMKEVAQILLEKYHLSVHSKNDQGMTPLHLASEKGYLDLVYLFLKKGGKVNAVDSMEQTAAHLAAKHGHVKILRLLRKFLGKLDLPNRFENRPLHRASANNQCRVLEYLLEEVHVDINPRNRDGQTPLHFAVMNGASEAVYKLIQNGADVNAKISSNSDRSSLHLAIKQGDEPIAEYLIHHDADVNAQDAGKVTPLHEAVANGHKHLCELLLDRGADVNATIGIELLSPLHVAAQTGNMEIVKLLISHGANINALNVSEQTPLHVASCFHHPDIVLFLLENKAKRNLQDVHGKYPSCYANSPVKRQFQKKTRWPSYLSINTSLKQGIFYLRDDSPAVELNLFPKQEKKQSKKLENVFLPIDNRKMENYANISMHKQLSSAWKNDGNAFRIPQKKKGKESKKINFLNINQSSRNWGKNRETKPINKTLQNFITFMDNQKNFQGADYEYYYQYFQELRKEGALKAVSQKKIKKWNKYFGNAHKENIHIR